MSRKAADAIIGGAALILCVINELVQPYLTGIAHLVSVCWFKDIFGAAAFTAYVDILTGTRSKQFPPRLTHILPMMLICGFFWEIITPMFRADTVADPVDILAYCLGGTIYWAGCPRGHDAS